ncbi:MAG: polysaccharide deacetylase family protein [Clostridiales bacterium]|nr:polysaccharide deacetylase family protein [Clostridiales bacterium]
MKRFFQFFLNKRARAAIFALVIALAQALVFSLVLTTAATATQAAETGEGVQETALAALQKQYESALNIIEHNVQNASSIPILTYHSFAKQTDANKKWSDDAAENSWILPEKQFEAQMDYLAENKFHTATLEELEQYLRGKLKLPDRTVVLTFDDGYRSNIEIAYPILKKHKFHAAVFLITGAIGNERYSTAASRTPLDFMNWTDLNRRGDAFSYYSHTHEMHTEYDNGTTKFAAEPLKTVTRDLITSKSLTGAVYFAYPHGRADARGKALLKEQGFRMAFIIERGYASRSTDRFAIPRFSVTPSMDDDEFRQICNREAS